MLHDGTARRAIGVTRRYGATVALDGVDLDVPAGSLTGLLGLNGAGKSTLLNLLVGLRRPDAGQVELFGGSPRDAARRRALGLTPQDTGLPAAEVLGFVARHYRAPLPAAEVLERFGLTGLERRQTGRLSGGQRRRLAVAFVGKPRLVVLDEPTTGLDVEARRALWDGVRAFHADGGTVLLTSHYLEEIEQLAQRVVVIGAGRILADGDLDQVRGVVALTMVSLRTPELPPLAGIGRVVRTGDRYELHTSDADRLVHDLVHSGVPFSDLQVRPASLEEAFLSLTTPEGANR
ncbi:ABC transporter ATP-binding protein [Pseudonocardia asaccharolytica]|uniref:ABC transporter ATP-binding protein n=1 Tax=Pseudonocardia asaccharolytica DSM 44247 = NBRC 16224 TaxID=1123024 RepID=A0A511CV99_9PSEU|nr:ABC transporter ATP-binding protein [Pseudonocardia asaccharolytica]GEL16500.1 ABC transporter ATP-binding protein [Pseudonocardia asaccharolytica DSM 44247 = NBRC 16224]